LVFPIVTLLLLVQVLSKTKHVLLASISQGLNKALAENWRLTVFVADFLLLAAQIKCLMHKLVRPLFDKSGISARLYLLISFTAIPLLLLIVWVYSQNYEARRLSALSTELDMAHAAATTFMAYFNDIRRQTFSLGQAILTLDSSSGPEKANALLRSSVSQYPSVRNLSWVNTDGIVIGASQPGMIGMSLAKRPFFNEIRAGAQWAISNLTPTGTITDSPTLAIATAIYDESGILAGVVVAGIEPQRLHELTLIHRRGSGAAYGIYDSRGTLVFHSRRPELSWSERINWIKEDPLLEQALRTGQPQTGRLKLPLNEGEWLSARVPIQQIGWVAGAGQPVPHALAPLKRDLLQDILLALAVFGGALGVARMVARTISIPIEHLAEDARRMGEGEIINRVDPLAPHEITRLRETVAGMAASLRERAEKVRMLAAVVENSSDFAGIFTPDCKAIYINPAGMRMLELNHHSEAQGMKLSDFLMPEDRDRLEAEILTALAQKRQWSGETRMCKPRSHETLEVLWSAFAIDDREGKLQAWAVINHDLTGQNQMAEALRQSEERYRLVHRATRDIIWDWDLLKNTLIWSDAAQLTFGQELPSGPSALDWWRSQLHPEDRDRVLDSIQRTIDDPGRQTWTSEYRFRHADGHWLHILDRGFIARDDKRQGTRMIGLLFDLTERKAMEEALRQSEERFRALADNISQLAWMADEEGRIFWFNLRWYEYTGGTWEDLQGRGWERFHHPDHVKRVKARLEECLASGETWEDTFPLRAKDGSYRWFLSRAQLLRDPQGRYSRWFGTNTDITEQLEAQAAVRKARDELAAANMALEKRVMERTAKLRETIGELEHFSYTITHDMRAPLRAMEAFGSILRQEYGHKLDDAGQDFIRRIIDSAKRMDALITDALNYSKIVRAELVMSPLDPGALLSSMVETYPEFQPGAADIRLDEPFPKVLGNQAALTQCFSNLLSNAVKFVKPGEVPKIRIWAQPIESFEEETGKPDPKVRIWFEDEGIGISGDQTEKIFMMFQRVSKSYEGTGIGLALVKKAMQRMNGKVGVESTLGKGSRFWLEFSAA
jgi:PAS domain S-box-containing protein